MQMLYLFRDYQKYAFENKEPLGSFRARQWETVAETLKEETESYAQRNTEGTLDTLRAFFDYAYFSFMFMQASREAGASKRSWALYRSRLAYNTAKKLGFLP